MSETREAVESGGTTGRVAVRSGLAARGFVALLDAYKRFISPWLPKACRFTPTCSEYARLAIEEKGALRGSVKACGRLCRCHPLHPGGLDLP